MPSVRFKRLATGRYLTDHGGHQWRAELRSGRAQTACWYLYRDLRLVARTFQTKAQIADYIRLAPSAALREPRPVPRPKSRDFA